MTRILVCDDEGLTALRVKQTLERLGYKVVGTATDGEEAVRKATDLLPDAITMDVRMPKLDGIGAVQQIMAACPTAIVMITAFNDRDLVDAALEAGASGYLVKPIPDEQIEPAIRLAMARFRELKDLHTEVRDLKNALEARKLVERAKNIIARRFTITDEEAYQRLQKMSRDRGQTMGVMAQQVISAADLLG
jgi:two-component system, response regulator PdtaR